jgi:hypothetical protein
VADPLRPRVRRGISLQSKFGLAYFGLAVLAGLAVGLLVVFLGRSGGGEEVKRPSWLTEHGTSAAQQIGDHVAGRYRSAKGDQLVAVSAGRPEITPRANESYGISKIFVRPGRSDDRYEDVRSFDAKGAVFYIICGLSTSGQQCSLPGKSTLKRGLFLRQAALDLAVYTFKYVPDFDSVVAFFPPPAGNQLQRMLYFRRPELKSTLDPLLARSQALGQVLTPSGMSDLELARVRQLTIPNLGTGHFSGFYQYAFNQTADGTAFLELAPGE